MPLNDSSKFLPKYLNTIANKRFLKGTLDLLVNSPSLERFNGTIGRHWYNGVFQNDNFIIENDSIRQNYQLEPAFIIRDANNNIINVNNFIDLLNATQNKGGIVNDWQRVLTSGQYSWKGFIDLDKLINYQNYCWMSIIDISNNWFWNNNITISSVGVQPNENWTVSNPINALLVSGLNNPNPELFVLRGGQYKFINNCSSGNLWIQTEPGISGVQYNNPSISTRNVSGVENNGSNLITFDVATIENNQFYLNLSTFGNSLDHVNAATNLNYDQINGLQLESIDGVTNLNGLTLIFANNSGTGWGSIIEDQWSGVWNITVIDGIINLTFAYNISNNFKVIIDNGTEFKGTQWYYLNTNSVLLQVPQSADLNTYFYLQNDSNPAQYLKINVLNENNLPQINVVDDILGQEFYTSPNGIEFKNGMKINFSALTSPPPFNDITKSWIIEGVGQSISLVPFENILLPEFVIDQNNPQDYITINRASLDLNLWSRTNQWIHKDTLNYVINILSQQINDFVIPTNLNNAVRPIIEFAPGMQLFGLGQYGLPSITYYDNFTPNAFEIVQGSKSFEIDGYQINTGDTVIFANDKNTTVRNQVYQIEFIDPTQSTQTPRLYPVQAATTGNISLIGKLTIDGYETQINDRILVWKQTDSIFNGIYEVSESTWTRTSDFTNGQKIKNNYIVLSLFGNTYKNDNFIIIDENQIIGTSPLTWNISNVNPTIQLNAIKQASDQNSVLITSGNNYLDLTAVWNGQTTQWNISPQNKTSINQPPFFDLFDFNENSLGNVSIYAGSSFTGSKLFSYEVGPGVNDTVLGFPIQVGVIGNLNDIIFVNNFESDTFSYNNISTQINAINTAHTKILTHNNIIDYTPWQYVDSNNKLYQNYSQTGNNICQLYGTLIIDNIMPTQVFVDGNQLNYNQFEVNQTTLNGLPTIVFEINESLVNANSEILFKILSSTSINNAWYDVPPSFESNPMGQTANTVSMSALRQHAFVSNTNLSKPGSVINLFDAKFNGVPGSLLFNESLSLLPTLLLTQSSFDIDQALKTAGEDYILFKQRFLNAINNIQNVQNLTPKLAVDQILQQIASMNLPGQAWYTSDMCYWGGINTNYIITDISRSVYNLQQSYDWTQPNTKNLQVYANNSQLIFGIDYTTNNNVLQLLRQFPVKTTISIYEINDSDGSYIPATPTKLGLAQSYIPQIYNDTSYQTPKLVIQGHDGSIMSCFNDYRDNLILEYELRVFNNLKVNNQMWADTIQVRNPLSGRFRSELGLSNYSQVEQSQILQRSYYEWAAQYNIEYTNNVYDSNNLFTWNWSGSLDKFTDQEQLLGYWRGVYNWFFDTNYPNLKPWEMLNLSIKPSWWDSTYGPAPYTGQNLVMWDDISNGIIRNPNGITYSSFGPRQFNTNNVLQTIPIDDSGNLLNPNQSIVGVYNESKANSDFVFGDVGPSEYAWRISSSYPFAKLRAQIIQNPLFMCGSLWDLNNYVPTVGAYQFKYQNTKLASISQIQLQSVDANARVNSLLNYSIEYLRKQGQDPTILRTTIDNAQVNLMYGIGGFTNVNNLSVIANSNNPTNLESNEIIPIQDFNLFLNRSSPTGIVIYSGLIITQVSNGYQISGYNKINPYFLIYPVQNGPSTNIGITPNYYSWSKNYSSNLLLVPYNTIFNSIQSVINFIAGYSQYLTSVGFQFEINANQDKITWQDSAVQFIKWALTNYFNDSLSLVLNPASSILKISLPFGTLYDLTDPIESQLIDTNGNNINIKYLDVYRSGNDITITHQIGGIFAALQANVINYEHRFVINNLSIFNNLIYDPISSLRQKNLIISGQKTSNWAGQVDIPGFLLTSNVISNWVPNQDYLKGSLVQFKNTNYVALNDIIGASSFQYGQFAITLTSFTNSLLPNLSLKAQDLSNAYNIEYRNYLTDIQILRNNAIGYIERDWLQQLNIDLPAQTDFYRGWIKEKGSLNSLQSYSRGSSPDFITSISVNEEYAMKVGEYGGTSRTGYVDVSLPPGISIQNPLIIQFVPQVDTSDTTSIQFVPFNLYQKSQNWNNDFIQNYGNLASSTSQVIQGAGPLVPSQFISQAYDTVPGFIKADENNLFWANISQLISSPNQQSILKIALNQGSFWLSENQLIPGENQWDAIAFDVAPGYVSAINQLSTNLVTFNITNDINAIINSVIVVNHIDNNSNVIIQGAFIVNDYYVYPSTNTVGILTIETANNQFQIGSINYSPTWIEKSIYTSRSLRGNSIAESNINSNFDQFRYVENDQFGWASYELLAPYPLEISVTDVPDQSAHAAIAYDSNNLLIWSGKPTAISDVGVVELRVQGQELTTTGNVIPNLGTEVYEVQSSRNDTFNLGYNVVSNQNGGIAASANTALTEIGQVYIAFNVPGTSPTITQILSGEGTSGNNAFFGQSLAMSSDSQWLYVGIGETTTGSNLGGIATFNLQTATPLIYTANITSPTNIILSSNIANVYSVTLTLNDPSIPLVDQILIANLDYNVSGNVVTLNFEINPDTATIYAVQQSQYYAYQGLIPSPFLANANFSLSLSCDTDGSTLAVGAPTSNNGQAVIYRRVIEKIYRPGITSSITVLSPFTNISKVTVNGILLNNSTYTISGSTITFASALRADSAIQIEGGCFELAQIISAPNSYDRLFGQSIAIQNNKLLIGSPLSYINKQLNKGVLYFYALDNSIETIKTINNTSNLDLTSTSIRVNDWIVVRSGSNIKSLVNDINSLTNFSGISVNTTGNNFNIITNNTLLSDGIGNYPGTYNNVHTLFSQYQLLGNVVPSQNNLINFGQNISWLSTDLFGVIGSLGDISVSVENESFADGTIFDGGRATFSELKNESTQQLTIYQMLETNRNWIDSNSDILNPVPVLQYVSSSVNQSQIVYAGDITNLLVCDRGNPDESVIIFNNPNLVHGWSLSSSPEPKIDSGSISAAWIYDSQTLTKLEDLEIVDITAGKLPGSLAEYLDYISDIDPANYNFPNWTPGTAFNIGDQVSYGGSIYQALYEGISGSIFNPTLWTKIIANNIFQNPGSILWGSDQVGQFWFNTQNLRVIDAQLGATLLERATNWNQWYPNDTIQIWEWVNSNNSPDNYQNNDTNGYVLDINCPYTYNILTKQYGFWVINKNSIGPIHQITSSQLSQTLNNIPDSGIPMVTALDTNAVAVWNINQFISSNSVILHLDYVIESGFNELHGEFALISNNGSKSWLSTPIYGKFIDSLSGQTSTSQLVPDIYLPTTQQYGISNNPEQSIFADRVTALLIYYTVINQQLANLAIASSSLTSQLSQFDPPPTIGFNEEISNRAVLDGLDINEYPENYKILIDNDNTLPSNGWSIVSSINGAWNYYQVQMYNLANNWEYSDWYAGNYISQPPTYVINTFAGLSSINYVLNDIIQVNNNGNGNKAIYQIIRNDIDVNVLELSPLYIQNGTIQFLPNLFNFSESEIGFDSAPFDTQGFDNDPFNEIRLITAILNENLLVGSNDLTLAADSAFFAVLQYIIHENENLDWLFKTSFISVNYNDKNLNLEGSYEPDDADTVQDFISESTPYHTRIRQFNDINFANEYANIGTVDFDLPAQYDANYANLIYNFSDNPKANWLLQLSQFRTDVGVALDQNLFYINSSGLPDHVTNAYPNSNVPFNITTQDWVFGFNQIPSNSQIAIYSTANNNIGPIASAINGVPFYSPNSGEQITIYLDSNLAINQTFIINTVWSDLQSNIDPGAGYPNDKGAFQYLTDPYLMYTKNSGVHSPIIGYAWDGNPIYGPYGYRNGNITSDVILQTSSYQLSNENRLTSNGTYSNGLLIGSYAAPNGQYIEDYIYEHNSGTLDEFNGIYCVTPEYPLGTYAYFITVNSETDAPVYPYVIGPNYWGIPAGLRYNFINGNNTPSYYNGSFKLPIQFNGDNVNYVRSPDGSIESDPLTLQQNIYSPWNNNHSYTLEEIIITNGGLGYTNPVVNLVSPDGSGQFGNAIAVWNHGTGEILSINVISGNSYTTTPQVTITDSTFTEPCMAYAVLKNDLIRQFDMTLRFDRVDATIEFWSANIAYNNGSVVYDSANAVFIQSIVDSNENSNLSNLSAWITANNYMIDTSTAMNRIQNDYVPNANIPGKQARLLISGADYPGVLLTTKPFVESYPIPTGSIFNQNDPINSMSVLNIQWNPGLLFDSTLSKEVFRFDNSAAYFNIENNQYLVANQNTPNIANLAMGTNDFTLEFFIRFTEYSNANTAMILDTRIDYNSANGFILMKDSQNNLSFGANSNISIMNSNDYIEGAINSNTWNFVTLQRAGTNLTMYLNGQLVSTANIGMNFIDAALTLGADVTGNLVMDGYMDELRLTTNLLRYPNGIININVPVEPFPRGVISDPYFVSDYTVLLLGFENEIDDSQNAIDFISINSVTMISDLSWNQKNLQLVNYDANVVVVNSTVIGPANLNQILTVNLNNE